MKRSRIDLEIFKENTEDLIYCEQCIKKLKKGAPQFFPSLFFFNFLFERERKRANLDNEKEDFLKIIFTVAIYIILIIVKVDKNGSERKENIKKNAYGIQWKEEVS